MGYIQFRRLISGALDIKFFRKTGILSKSHRTMRYTGRGIMGN